MIFSLSWMCLSRVFNVDSFFVVLLLLQFESLDWIVESVHKFCTCCLFHRKVPEIADSQPLSSLASSLLQVVYVNGYTHIRSVFFWRGVSEMRYTSFYWCTSFEHSTLVFCFFPFLLLFFSWSLLFMSFSWWIRKQNSSRILPWGDLCSWLEVGQRTLLLLKLIICYISLLYLLVLHISMHVCLWIQHIWWL